MELRQGPTPRDKLSGSRFSLPTFQDSSLALLCLWIIIFVAFTMISRIPILFQTQMEIGITKYVILPFLSSFSSWGDRLTGSLNSGSLILVGIIKLLGNLLLKYHFRLTYVVRIV